MVAVPPADERAKEPEASSVPTGRIGEAQDEGTDEGTRAAGVGTAADLLHKRLLNNAAHGLRTPLTPIKASIHVLRSRLDTRFDPGTEVALETLDQQTRRLSDLIDDILDVSALETGRLQLWPTPCSLTEIVRTETDAWNDRARRSGIDLSVRIEGDIKISADASRLRRVLRHMITNAFEQVEEHGRIEVEAAREDREAAVRIRSTGRAPVAESTIDAFPDFGESIARRISEANRDSLGLAFCKGVIDSLGGSIWFGIPLASTRTTEVAFRIPRQLPDREHEAGKTATDALASTVPKTRASLPRSRVIRADASIDAALLADEDLADVPPFAPT